MPTTENDVSPVDSWESEGGAVVPGDDLVPMAARTGLLEIGFVTRLRAGQGVGFVMSDTHSRPWELRFRQADVKFHHFDRLNVGDRVRFLRAREPGSKDHQHAILVEAWPDRMAHRGSR